ncbi:MAG: glycosyltransferase [Trueperaceae bacterium]|nr:glycosyltransferase [Trueperaceae bacterium]
MRVAFLIPVFPEIHNTFILNQITGLIDLGHEVHLYPLAVGDYQRAHADVAAYGLKERVRHIPIPGPHGQRLRKLAGLMTERSAWRKSVAASLDPFGGKRTLSLEAAYTALSFARQQRYDVIHAQFGHLGDAALAVSSTWGGSGVPVVTSFRGADTTARLDENPRFYDKLFQRGALFLPVSEDLKRRLIDHGAPSERTKVHHSGIALSRFTPNDRAGAKNGHVNALFIGRFVEKKGVQYALEALALVTDTADVTLTLVGDGPLEPELRRRADELGLAARVDFVGEKNQAGVLEELARADVLVAPSVTAASGDKEGIPNVAKEAMACALPVLSTLHGGIPELIEDGVSGFLVPERDVQALAERLKLLASRPDLRAKLGAAGREKVAAEFDSKRLNVELVELYGSLAGGAR